MCTGNWLLGLGFLLLVIGKLKVFYYRTLYITGDVKEIDNQKVGKFRSSVFTHKSNLMQNQNMSNASLVTPLFYRPQL